MTKILIIDDEPIYHKLTQRALQDLGYEIGTANNGREGIEVAKEFQPDVIVSDLKMPDMDGYDVIASLRRDPLFAHIPILILTANTELEDKLTAFEKGADDYLGKPFNPDEFRARIRVLVQRGEVAKTARTLITTTQVIESFTIAVHSLRGGVGCTSLSLNLAVAINNLWERPTIIIDGVLDAGQVALMLNASSKHTWADLVVANSEAPSELILQSIVSKHESGLNFIAAPAFPVDAEIATPELIRTVLDWVRQHYDYIFIDVAHSFDAKTLPMLDFADLILLVLAPEMASVRAAAAAINTYEQLDYPSEKIRLMLNWTFPRRGLVQKQIEKALKKQISLVVPYTPDLFIGAINMGYPILLGQHEHAISVMLENMAYQISQEQHKKIPPIKPSNTWKRVTQRLKH